MKTKTMLVILIAIPATIFTIRSWLWVFGIVQPLTGEQAAAGVMMGFFSYAVAWIIYGALD